MKNLEVGQRIRFSAMDEFTGQQIEVIGDVEGDYKEVRKKWPEEMALADKDVYLVCDFVFQDRKYAVHISELLQILNKEEK